MLVLRPVELADLPRLQKLARESLVGVTSLPDDSERLREKILDSCASFQAALQKTEDHLEAMTAFFEKRPGNYKGR